MNEYTILNHNNGMVKTIEGRTFEGAMKENYLDKNNWGLIKIKIK